jgi:pentatricopeptide repeat-containing protein PET309
MLERATACLDSGARLSVRCARRASRSNRSLGATFWNHGAGDLDLSLWATSHIPQSAIDVRGSTQQSRRVSKKEQGKRVDSTPVESPFLDFLYPPQALALLRRNGGRYAERWEVRNERRLPKGFVQANRRYSSKAKRRSAPTEIVNDDTADDLPHDCEEFEADTPHSFAGDALACLDGSTDERVNVVSTEWEAPKDIEAPKDDTLLSPSSPVELAERAESMAAGKALKDLRLLIDTPGEDTTFEDPEKSLEYTELVWSLFEKLGPNDRARVGLRTQLLEWLSYHSNEAAETHCLELYHSIPVPRRSLRVYKSALSAFIRSNLYGLAEECHAEALDQLENGHEVSIWLCSTAIEMEMWDLASRIKHQLDVKYTGESKKPVETAFWRHIAETPELLSKAINLSKHYRMLSQSDAMTTEFDNFSANMFKVAIVRQFTTRTTTEKRRHSRARKTLDDGRIRYLIGRIQLTNANPPAFLRDVLEALVQPDSKIQYHDAHNTVSYMYRQHCAFKHVFFTRKILYPLMKRVVEFLDSPAGRWQQRWSVSPSKIQEHWIKRHGKMDFWMHYWLMEYYAVTGNVELVQYSYENLLAEYPLFSDHKDALWALVYVHARRADVPKATAAFEQVQATTTAAGEKIELKLWNVLLHAHSRAGDMNGALEVMQKLLAAGYKPDKYSFHPVTELYAGRGDVDGVLDWIEEYDSLSGSPRATELYGSLMTAHINANDVSSAQKVLDELIPKVRAGEVVGTLTKCFNILLTGLALSREIDKTMRVYRWMKDEEVQVDNSTYAALMQALTAYRQTDAAWKILKVTMPEQNLEPQAFHYAVVMTGFVRQRAYSTVMGVHKIMLSNNIKPSLTTNAIFLKAKALYELRQGPWKVDNGTQYPVQLIVEELEEVFRDPAGGLAAHEPQSFSPQSDHSPEALLISHLIQVYGAARSMEAVQNLVDAYKRSQQKDENGGANDPLPLRLLSAVMPSYIQTEQWGEAGRCWELANEQADAIAIQKPVPGTGSESDTKRTLEILQLPVAKTINDVTQPGSLLAKPKRHNPSKPAPAHRHILSLPLRHHINALALQARFAEMISTVASVLSRGYTMDNSTWNIFIGLLLRRSPPLALLAFRLTERYLIPSFPGWMKGKPTVNLSARKQGLEYIRARYLSPDKLMPRYKTLVRLAAALLELRRLEALGTRTGAGELQKYVGSTREIRQLAPRTLYAIQSMPAVEDTIQTSLLRRQYRT